MHRSMILLVVATVSAANVGCEEPTTSDAGQGGGSSADLCESDDECHSDAPCSLAACVYNYATDVQMCKTVSLSDGVSCDGGNGYCFDRSCIQYDRPPPHECDTPTDCGYMTEGCMFADCRDHVCFNGYYVPGTPCVEQGSPSTCSLDAEHKRTVCLPSD